MGKWLRGWCSGVGYTMNMAMEVSVKSVFHVVAAGMIALASSSSASATETTYGAAGCGLGSVLFGDEGGFVQVFAATTNGFFGNQTLGITFGTLNCGEGALDTVGARVFIEANREALAKDIARGSGETLSSLSALAGCADDAAVGATLQQHYTAIFPDQSVPADAVSDAIMTTLSDPALQCTDIG